MMNLYPHTNQLSLPKHFVLSDHRNMWYRPPKWARLNLFSVNNTAIGDTESGRNR
jgi:hypothetical protein